MTRLQKALKVPAHVSTRRAEATLWAIAIVLTVIFGAAGLWIGHWFRGLL